MLNNVELLLTQYLRIENFSKANLFKLKGFSLVYKGYGPPYSPIPRVKQ